VLSGVALICRTSSGPTFHADHTLIDTAHPQVVDRSGQASVGRMTAICQALGSARPTNGSYRRVSPVAMHLGEGRLTEPAADIQPGRPGPVFMPQIRPPSVRYFPWYKGRALKRGCQNMQRSAWVALLLVVLAGWGIAG